MPDTPTTPAPSGALPVPVPPILSPAQRRSVINIVRRAARAEILPRFRNLATGDIRQKTSASDLVTDADTQAEAMITRALQIAFPSALVIGEEAVADRPALLDGIGDAALAFIVDPVDGTWNFAHGLPLFGVIVAATRFGKPAFGMIYDPLADDWAIADEEMAPQLQRATGAPRTLRASTGKPLTEMMGVIPLAHFAKDKQAELAACLPDFARVPNYRCSAVEYRLLAQGHIDFCLTANVHAWDHAAGALIAARAGACVRMLDGSDYDATLRAGHLLVAPDAASWRALAKRFAFLLDAPDAG